MRAEGSEIDPLSATFEKETGIAAFDEFFETAEGVLMNVVEINNALVSASEELQSAACAVSGAPKVDLDSDIVNELFAPTIKLRTTKDGETWTPMDIKSADTLKKLPAVVAAHVNLMKAKADFMKKQAKCKGVACEIKGGYVHMNLKDAKTAVAEEEKKDNMEAANEFFGAPCTLRASFGLLQVV
eukprot:SAG11_NODE_2557_length_3221_cov_3.516336_8_plen_185_part_00